MHGLKLADGEHQTVRQMLRKQIYCGKMLFFLMIKENCTLYISDLYLGYQRALIIGARHPDRVSSEKWKEVISLFIWTLFYRLAVPRL